VDRHGTSAYGRSVSSGTDRPTGLLRVVDFDIPEELKVSGRARICLFGGTDAIGVSRMGIEQRRLRIRDLSNLRRELLRQTSAAIQQVRRRLEGSVRRTQPSRRSYQASSLNLH
jgi:hypothetical protein